MYHLKQIPTDTQIKKFLKGILFGKYVFCPQCKGKKITSRQQRYYCRDCRKRFSLTSHTWLSDMKLPLSQFWLVLWCWTKQFPVKQTQELTNLSEKAVRHNFDCFRSHLPRNQELLEHIIQLDEAYFGGWGGISLLMGKQKGTRKIAYKVIPQDSVARVDALEFLRSSVKPNSKLWTDGSTLYQNINKHFPVDHTYDYHKAFEFKHTSEIEGMFGVLRTFIRRMYHHTSKDKFDDYMLEFYWRFSRPEIFKSPRQYLINTLSLVPTG